MIRITDQIVADWGLLIWEYNGQIFEQVEVLLFNGMTFIINEDEFFEISSDEGC